MSESENTSAGAAKSGRYRFVIPLALVLGMGVGYGIYWLLVVRGTVYTDDARIKTMLVPSSSRVGGRVVELLVREGDVVEKGQTLVRLDDMPYRPLRDEAAAGVKASEAELTASRLNLLAARLALGKEVAIAQAEVRAAQAREQYSKKQLDRFSRLDGMVTRDQVDKVETAWSGSDAALEATLEKLGLLFSAGASDGDTAKSPRELEILMLDNKVTMAESKLAVARAKLDMAEDNLSELEVKALEDGQVSRRHVELGQVVAPGQKLFSIAVLKHPWIGANFEEDDVAVIRPGDKARIKVDAYGGRVFHGHVEGVLGAAISEFSLLSAGSSSGNYIKVTQRVPVIIALDDHDLPFLPTGINAEVRVVLQSAPAAGGD